MTTVGIARFLLNRSSERRRLLSFFISNEDREFYLRELERITGISVGNIRRELNRLMEDRLFVCNKKGNSLYYRLNKHHPFYRELKTLLLSAIGMEIELKKVFAGFPGIEEAFIFGSYASGKARSDSDIDLMIIGSPDRNKLIKLVSDFEEKYRRPINFQVYSRENINRKKTSNNSFIGRIFEGPRIILKGDMDETGVSDQDMVDTRKNKKRVPA